MLLLLFPLHSLMISQQNKTKQNKTKPNQIKPNQQQHTSVSFFLHSLA